MIKILDHGTNKGLANAITSGIDAATGRLTVTLDEDFTFHPRQIKNFLNAFNKSEVDIVIGSPNLGKGYFTEVPKHRIIISKAGAPPI